MLICQVDQIDPLGYFFEGEIAMESTPEHLLAFWCYLRINIFYYLVCNEFLYESRFKVVVSHIARKSLLQDGTAFTVFLQRLAKIQNLRPQNSCNIFTDPIAPNIYHQHEFFCAEG